MAQKYNIKCASLLFSLGPAFLFYSGRISLSNRLENLDKSWQQGGGGGHPVGGQGQAARVRGRGTGQWRPAHTLVPAHIPGGKGMYHEIT